MVCILPGGLSEGDARNAHVSVLPVAVGTLSGRCDLFPPVSPRFKSTTARPTTCDGSPNEGDFPLLHNRTMLLYETSGRPCHDGQWQETRIYAPGRHCNSTVVLKQTRGTQAERDCWFLDKLAEDSTSFFPRVSSVVFDMGQGWSACLLERIDAVELRYYIAAMVRNNDTASIDAILFRMLDALEVMERRGVTHRDLFINHWFVRDGDVVVLDFSWAVSADMPYDEYTPYGLGGVVQWTGAKQMARGFSNTRQAGHAIRIMFTILDDSTAVMDRYRPWMDVMIDEGEDQPTTVAGIRDKLLRSGLYTNQQREQPRDTPPCPSEASSPPAHSSSWAFANGPLVTGQASQGKADTADVAYVVVAWVREYSHFREAFLESVHRALSSSVAVVGDDLWLADIVELPAMDSLALWSASARFFSLHPGPSQLLRTDPAGVHADAHADTHNVSRVVPVVFVIGAGERVVEPNGGFQSLARGLFAKDLGWVEASALPSESHAFAKALGLEINTRRPKFQDVAGFFVALDRLEQCVSTGGHDRFSYVVLTDAIGYPAGVRTPLWGPVFTHFFSLEGRASTTETGTLELLVSDLLAATAALGALPATAGLQGSSLYTVSVGGSERSLRLRHVGDGYVDAWWQSAVLKRRFRFRDFYVPPDIELYDWMLYSVTVFQPEMTVAEEGRLRYLGNRYLMLDDHMYTRATLEEFVHRMLAAKGAYYTVPQDPSVHRIFNIDVNLLPPVFQASLPVGPGRPQYDADEL